MKKYIIVIFSILSTMINSSCSDEKVSLENMGVIPEPKFVTDSDYYTLGDRVYIQNETPNDANISSFFWHFGFEGVGNYSTEKEPVYINYTRAGHYIIKLTATNNEGGYKTFEKEILINRINDAPIADFEAIVNGLKVEFTDTSTDDEKVISWIWDFGDGNTSTEQSPEHTYSITGLLTVTLTVSDELGETNSREKKIYVRSTPAQPGSFQILWTETFETSSKLRSVSPAVGDNGDIYVTSNSNFLHSFSPTGQHNWAFDLSRDGASGNQESSPMIDIDGTIYIGVGYGSNSSMSYLYAINQDGAMNWSYEVGAGARIAYSSPTMTADGYIAIGNRGTGGSVKVINRNGGFEWTTVPSGGTGGGLAASKIGNVYSGSTGSNGFAISNNGKISTTYIKASTGAGANGSQPAIDAAGNVYTVHNVGSIGVVVCSSADGSLLWEYSTGAPHTQGGPVIGRDGTVYVGCAGGKLSAISRSGAQRWVYIGMADITSVPAIDSEGFIHFTDEGGNYTILNSDGSLKFTQKIGDKIWSSPVISDYGIIYVTVEDGGACKLLAIDFGVNGPASSDWPQRGQNARRAALQK